jgi:DNA-binding NarL/FixJ family response regulator
VKHKTPTLNSRQTEILVGVRQGKRNKEIAHDLGLSERTIKWYISQLFLIFGASNRAELVALASEGGTMP